MNESIKIRPRDRDAILQSLRAGVVPRAGQHLVQVGRAAELTALIADIERIADGGSGFRLVIGEYGSGKTFFLNLTRSIAMEKKLVTMHADLNPDRRLHASGGQARSLYAELTRNVATRSKPEGGAFTGVVERFVATATENASARGVDPDLVIKEMLADLTEMVNGFDFALVVSKYYEGYKTDNADLQTSAIRWLRGEFSTKTEARQLLGVRTIVDDSNFYDQLKLLGRFVRLAGFGGILVCLDELVNLYKLPNTQARTSNYEQILRILNDSLQGSAEGIGFVLGGTPDFLYDSRRGLYSYQALQSRLAENTFAGGNIVDLTGPVIKLVSLTPEDFYVLLQKIRLVYSHGDHTKYLLPDDGIVAFLNHCAQRLGESYYRTPRTTITAFINLLAVLDQNPDTSWQELVGSVEVVKDTGAQNEVAAQDEEDDELAEFKL
ncbi:ATP-binding protein [Cellvibrio sp. UBA7671]|jgi:hypothetical protein|uniref:ATP-binding protein n=1 Tax=Cellvibrio sp. UBA7671 TaxID=1946312 RepID=UPI002F357F71